MTDVTIVYNAFLNAMKIHIDGRPIPPISRLTKFQTMPFEHWCSEIFPAIAEEVNDRFTVTYMGRPCESHILSSFVASCSFCASYVNRQPDIPDSALTRLKKLSSLCQSGVSCEKFSTAVHVYTDMDVDQISDLVRSSLPKLAYCRIIPKVHTMADVMAHPDDSPFFVICNAGTAISGMKARKSCVLMVGRENGNASCKNGIFSEKVHPDMLAGMLKSYLELLLYPYVLNRALASVKVPESSPLYPSVSILDKTEPQTLVTLPNSIELGEVAEVRVRTIPEGAKTVELMYRISDESVITRSGNGLKAVGTGEAVVEVYVAGQTVKLCSGKITAHRRNRIQSIKIQQNSVEMRVGDKCTLSYTYTPTDADNVSSVKLVSSDGTVAASEHGMTFYARKEGTCRMYVQAEKVSACTLVTVYPRLENLKLELENERMRVGDIVPLKVTRVPENAKLEKLSFRVEPSSLGIYDTATHSFYAKGTGKGTITVSDKSGTVKASCGITVGAGGGKGCLGPLALGVGAVIALVLAIIL